VWDTDGNRYVDLTAAFGVASVGHTNPRVVAAVNRQSRRLLHAMGDVHPNELKVRLAEELVAVTFGRWLAPSRAARDSSPDKRKESPARVLFTNTGSESVEAALKTAALHTGRPGVIAFTGAYHGLTYGALAATWRDDFRSPFRSQLGDFVDHLPWGVVPAAGLPRPISFYGAVLVEPIQGRGGIIVPPDDFLPGLRAFCAAHGLVLIFDEVYTGLGRTGHWFAGEHWGVVPDIVCVGKALGGGLPISACVGRAAVMRSWPPSRGEAIHTSTFQGHPLGCAAALAVLAELRQRRLPERAARLGHRLLERLRSLPGLSPDRVRGRGLMVGIEVGDAFPLVKRLLRRGLIALPEGSRGEVLSILPPLTISRRQLDHALAVLADLLGVRRGTHGRRAGSFPRLRG
ncbi:aminotransferase class III-fold pyridoxal phosphate-dependent enzyme, partial [bacterium]|nr:aminotransferase class III-fold pyridoxal phosphate-dependent enzyme [bacterium]